MEIKTFIEKAIEGDYNDGWNNSWDDGWEAVATTTGLSVEGIGNSVFISIEKLVLQPEFWEAVGKVDGWEKNENYQYTTKGFALELRWATKMQAMTDHLIEGGTIESYIKTL